MRTENAMVRGCEPISWEPNKSRWRRRKNSASIFWGLKYIILLTGGNLKDRMEERIGFFGGKGKKWKMKRTSPATPPPSKRCTQKGAKNFLSFFIGSFFGGKKIGRFLRTPGDIWDEKSVHVFPQHILYSF